MFRLFAGRENIDKERFIYDRIKERGGETFVLVPNQYTLVAEEQALRYLGSDCLFDVEILSMNRLGLRVLTEQGTESVRMLDKYGRFMLLSRLIREHIGDFEIFRRSAGKLTFTTMLNDFISEFKQQNCSLGKLREMAEDCKDDPILEAKLKELSSVIEAYETQIDGAFTDSEDYIDMYIDAIKDSSLVKGNSFWIYGYDSVTPKFIDAMLELADAAESVNFILNRSDFGLDEKMEAILLKSAAERGITADCEEIGQEYAMPRSETVERIERSLWKNARSAEETEANRDFVPEDLTLVCASNPYFEAENAAAFVWHLIRDLGYRMNDIQLIANDEGSMQPIIRRVFAEYGLQVFADMSRDITDSAAVGFIVNLLGFVRYGKLPQFLFAALKTGLSGYGESDIEDLENYVRNYRIRGSMWDKPFRYGADELGPEAFSALDKMREDISSRIAKLTKIAGADTVAEFTEGFRKHLQAEWKLADRVEEAAAAQEAAGLHDEAQRMTQSFEKAVELFDQIDEIMGDSGMDIAEFMDIYTTGLSDIEVGVIPPSVDGLSIGTMIRTRPRRMKAVVIMGANEGVLPLQPQTEGLFSLDEKNFFEKKGFELGRLDDLKMEEENAAMYRMMARPSEKIYISYSLTDAEGRDASPSPVIDSLTALFPRIEKDGLIRKDMISMGWNEKLIQTADDGMRHLINRIKDRNAPETPDHLTKALLRWYSDNRPEELKRMLDAAASENDPEPLKKATARELFGRADGSLVMSASSISGYADCPFKYYVDRGLRPKEEREFRSDSRSVGDVYHECLMAVAGRLMGDEALLKRLTGGSGANGGDGAAENDELEQLVTAALDEISSRYRGGLFVSAGSEEYRMSRIKEICAAAARAMAAQLGAESLTDAHFEEEFGRRGTFGPIKIRSGETDVYVEGKIDRADYLTVRSVPEDDPADEDAENSREGEVQQRVRIIDYKTGSDTLDLWKMRQGIRMQLMIYMISASGGGIEPAGMFYFNIKDQIASANDKSSNQIETIINKEPEDLYKLKGAFINEGGVLEAMPKSVLTSDKGGISREEFEEVRSDVLDRIEETADGILSGRISIMPYKENNTLVCRYCGYRSVCRRDSSYAKNAGRTTAPKPKPDDQKHTGK